MARTRNIKPSFFKNEYLAECDPLARLLFVGLWTLADSAGRMEYRPLRIKAELFPYESCDIVPMFKQLADRGFIVVYKVNDKVYLQIPTFSEHQRCHPSEQPEGFPACESGQAVIFHGEQLFSAANCALSSLSSFPSSNPSALVATSEPPKRRTRSQPPDAVSWSADAGWQGITDADRQEWAQAFPACDLTGELAKATSWLKANPTRAHKSNWRRFLVSWLTRSQDKGGTNRQPGVRPGTSPPPQDAAKRRFWRGDAGENMSDAEYSLWRRDKRQGGTVAALASSVRLTEEVTQ